MKAIGITCGIGSMLVGARQAGFEIVGNIEWRRYYHHRDSEGRNTFEENFPGAIFAKSIDDLSPEEIEKMTGADLAMGHPECGNFSNMTATAQYVKSLSEFNNDPGDIPIFVDLVKRLKPRFFVQDNLPKSLMGYSVQQWAENLPEYDLFPEWICNWSYGNIQKYRKRFFMIGALKTEKYRFIAGENVPEDDPRHVLRNLLEGIDEEMANQDVHTLEASTSKGKGIFHENFMTFAEYREYMLREPDGVTITYKAADGTWKKHVGCRKAFKDGYVPVVTGGVPIANPFTGLPFTLRERARIQGLPDDFIIYGTNYLPDGTWNHQKNGNVNRQLGKCMPVQFCYYVAEQIARHIRGEEYMDTGKRVLNPNPLIDEAKQWLCKNHGFSNEDVCECCANDNCEDRYQPKLEEKG